MSSAPEAKRQRTARDGVLSSKSDLQIVVEDEAFQVHSIILELVSPVFRQMLSTDMSEGLQKQVKLPGKAKEEFLEFYDILQPMTLTELTKENVTFLSKWADEYQVETLKNKCEHFLIEHVKVDAENWVHAQAYNLPRRQEQCYTQMQRNITEHLDGLAKLGPKVPDEMLQSLWPCLCNAAGIEFFDMPKADAIHSLWPFVASGVRYGGLYKFLEDRSYLKWSDMKGLAQRQGLLPKKT